MHMASQNKILDVSSEFDDFSPIGGCRSAEEASVCKTAVWLAKDVKALYQETRFYFFFSGTLICVAPLTHLLRSTLLFSPCSIYSLVLFACSLARSLIYGKGWSSSRRRTLDVIPIMMQVKQGSYGTLCVTVLPSVHPSVCLCIHPSVCPSVHLPVCLRYMAL